MRKDGERHEERERGEHEDGDGYVERMTRARSVAATLKPRLAWTMALQCVSGR